MRLDAEPVGDLAAHVVAGVSEQVELHIDLFRAQLVRDGARLTHRLLPFGVLLPMIGLGYGLLCIGLSLGAGLVLGPAAGFALVGLLNLAPALVGLRMAMTRLRAEALHAG